MRTEKGEQALLNAEELGPGHEEEMAKREESYKRKRTDALASRKKYEDADFDTSYDLLKRIYFDHYRYDFNTKHNWDMQDDWFFNKYDIEGYVNNMPDMNDVIADISEYTSKKKGRDIDLAWEDVPGIKHLIQDYAEEHYDLRATKIPYTEKMFKSDLKKNNITSVDKERLEGIFPVPQDWIQHDEKWLPSVKFWITELTGDVIRKVNAMHE